MSTPEGNSSGIQDDASGDSDVSQQRKRKVIFRGKKKGGRGRGRGKILAQQATPSVHTRSQKLKDSNPSSSAMSLDSQQHGDSRRSLWKEDPPPPPPPPPRADFISQRLCHDHRQDFDIECRADPDLAVLAGKKFKVWDGNHRVTVWLQVSAEAKYRNSLVHHPRVRCVIISPPPTALKEMEVAMHNLNITSHATVQYDWIQDAERTFQVLSTPLVEYKPLLGEKVYAELEESRKKTSTKGWYSEHMTITTGAYIMSYSEVMAAQKELIMMEKETETKGQSFSDEERNEKWKKLLSNATRHWNALIQKYATIVYPQLGPEFMSTVRELHTTLSQKEKGKREVKVEVGVDRIKAFASAPVPPDLKVKLLKVHYSGDSSLKSKFHHPQGNDLDDVRPWLSQWGVWAMLETYCHGMLVECFKLQPGYDPDKVYAEEENFLKHVEEYRLKFWTEVWNSTERNVLNDGRRAKRLFFRYAVWIRRFDIYLACFTLWRLPPSDLFSMFSNDDRLSRKWEEIAEWERENCPFYVHYIINPPVPFDEWEELCYQRRVDTARTQFAIEENASHPELLPELIEAHRLMVEKLPQVFDPTKLQKLSPEETVKQAKKFEPKVEQVLQVFTKLKRKKPVVEEKTPAKSTAEPSKQTSEEPPEQSSGAAPRSGRKQGKKKTAPVEDNVPPPTADLPPAPANPPPVNATVLNEEPAVTVAVPTGVPAVVLTTAAADIGTEEVDQTQVERQAKRLKRKAETKDFSNGQIRPDLQFQMEKKWVAVTSNLVGVIFALKQKRQQGRVSDPILAIEEIAKICGRLRTA
ncbi:hypothetical protein R1sor_008878 [Riccia sorocarpa]|uniref:Uncharacterized protein n=1 Tax=Riccia sorocarpa TaxID=122646 RepID=A0ABD3H849_9MARC